MEHHSLANLATQCAKLLGLGKGTRVLQAFPFSFDGHLLDIAPALVVGSTLCLKPEGVVAGEELARFMSERRINTAVLTPSRLATLEGYNMPDLQVLGAGGEALSHSLMAHFSSR